MTNKYIKKQIYISPRIETALKERAVKYGVTLPEYIRFVLAKDVVETNSVLDSETLESAGKSIKEYESGNFVEKNGESEIQAFLDQIV